VGGLCPSSGLVKRNAKVRISLFSQHHVDQLDMRQSAIAFLASLFPGLGEEEYRSQLGRFGVTAQLATRPISTLSGGQKSRVVFARIAMEKPRILVLDEVCEVVCCRSGRRVICDL
jgi:ATP-binding cassette subfamily F protein 3